GAADRCLPLGINEDVEVVAERNADGQNPPASCSIFEIKGSEPNEPLRVHAGDRKELPGPEGRPPWQEPGGGLEWRSRGRAPPHLRVDSRGFRDCLRHLADAADDEPGPALIDGFRQRAMGEADDRRATGNCLACHERTRLGGERRYEQALSGGEELAFPIEIN